MELNNVSDNATLSNTLNWPKGLNAQYSYLEIKTFEKRHNSWREEYSLVDPFSYKVKYKLSNVTFGFFSLFILSMFVLKLKNNLINIVMPETMQTE